MNFPYARPFFLPSSLFLSISRFLLLVDFVYVCFQELCTQAINIVYLYSSLSCLHLYSLTQAGIGSSPVGKLSPCYATVRGRLNTRFTALSLFRLE